MATRRFAFNGVAGTSHYLALFRASDGYVFDFDDNTWTETIGGATTPYVAGTERANLGGTGYSGFFAAVDLADVNATATPVQVIAQWFTDTSLAVSVSDFSEYTIVGGDLDDVPDTREIRGTINPGDDGTVLITVWLVRDGRNVALASGSCSVVCREATAGVDAWTDSSSTVVDGYYFNVSHALGDPERGQNWLFEVTITDPDGATVTETFGLAAV